MARNFRLWKPRFEEPVLKATAENPFGHLCGWNKAAAQNARQVYTRHLPRFQIRGAVTDYKGQRRMLWEYTRKVLGKDTDNYAQEIGDCVSFGGKNVLEHLSAVQIALNGKAEKWHAYYPPWFYGASRVFVGGGSLWGDGSTGAWLQEAVKKYGCLAADEQGVPQYSGSVAKQWGRGSGPPQQFVPIAQKHLVKTTALVPTAADAANAILNGYPCNVCSNWGFRMEASSDGFHAPSGTWGHCMTLIGFEDHPQHGFYFIILNSWGDVHGRLTDFTSGQPLPVGVLRVRAQYVEKMLDDEDSFAFSAYDGYPDQTSALDKALFDIVGN